MSDVNVTVEPNNKIVTVSSVQQSVTVSPNQKTVQVQSSAIVSSGSVNVTKLVKVNTFQRAGFNDLQIIALIIALG